MVLKRWPSRRAPAPSRFHGRYPCRHAGDVYAVRSPQEDPALERAGDLSLDQMGAPRLHAGSLLPAAVRALDARPARALAGGADRSRARALPLLLHRAVAAGGLLHHGPAD